MSTNNREAIREELSVASQAADELFSLAFAFEATGNSKVANQLSHLAEDLGQVKEKVSNLMHQEVMAHLNHGNKQLGEMLSHFVFKEDR